jgi:hypothetical protein
MIPNFKNACALNEKKTLDGSEQNGMNFERASEVIKPGNNG